MDGEDPSAEKRPSERRLEAGTEKAEESGNFFQKLFRLAVPRAEEKKKVQETGDTEEKRPPLEVKGLTSRRKLRLLTEYEEKERAFRAAREQYIRKVTEIRPEARKKGKDLRFYLDRLMAMAGFFLLVVGTVWIFRNFDMLKEKWDAVVQSVSTALGF